MSLAGSQNMLWKVKEQVICPTPTPASFLKEFSSVPIQQELQ